MNDFIIVGNIISDVEIKKSESGSEYANILLSSKRNYKNKEGEFEEDTYQLTLFKTVLDEVKDVLEKDTTVSIKGHLSANNNTSNKDKTYYSASLIADHIEPYI